jgi:hypothetical protein
MSSNSYRIDGYMCNQISHSAIAHGRWLKCDTVGRGKQPNGTWRRPAMQSPRHLIIGHV